MPSRSPEERDAEIRRKLIVGIEQTKNMIRFMSPIELAANQDKIDAWVAAADDWLEGRVQRYPDKLRLAKTSFGERR